MSATVTPEWLGLREAADAAARSEELAEILARHVAAPLVIHDLGGGTGSMGRWLAPRLPGPQHWVVHDRDPDLLALATGVETRRSDVTRANFTGASLVTASALLDLLTAAELERILTACAGIPILFALTVVGRVALTPAEPLDAALADAFNAHQRRHGLLGPDAVTAAFTRLRGVEVLVRPSPWRLGAAESALAAEWLEGWVAAACEQEPGLAAEAAGYRERRLAQAAAGALGVTVDHADLLVLP
jgi:hypothetical protein